MRDRLMVSFRATCENVDMSRPSISAERKEQIGARVRLVRAALASSQIEFCHRLGVLPQTWNSYEDGRMPAPEYLDKLFTLHGVTSDYLRNGSLRGMPVDLVERLEKTPTPERRKNGKRVPKSKTA